MINYDDFFKKNVCISNIDLEPIGYYNSVHGFLYDECDKDCYCLGGCSMQPVYTEEQVNKMIADTIKE